MSLNFYKQYKGLRKEVYILFIGRIVTRFGSMVWSMLTLILNQKLGHSASEVSVLMLVFSAVTMLTSVLGGKLADRYNKKNIIIICDCISIVLYLSCVLFPISDLTVAFIVVAASAQWMEHPAYNALIADITVTEDRAKAYALQYLGTNIGLMAAPTLAGFLFKNHIYMLFIICGCAIAVSTVLIFFKVKNITPVVEADQSLQQRRDGVSIWKILSENKILILFTIIMGLYSAAYDQYNYLIPLDLGRIYGEDGALLYGTISSTNCIIVVIFSSIILQVFSSVRPAKKILVAEFLMMAGFVIFLSFINYIPAYYIAIILFTLGEICVTISDAPFMTEHSPASHRGRINGFEEVVRSSINGILLLVVGRLYDDFGYISAWEFVIAMLVIAVILTIVLIKKTSKRGFVPEKK